MCMVGLGINSLLLAVSMCFFDIHKALVRQRRETDNVETGRRKVRVLWVGGSLPDGCFNIKHETARCLPTRDAQFTFFRGPEAHVNPHLVYGLRR